jgi:hypothetical protein
MEVSLNSNNGSPYSYDYLNNIGINPYVLFILIIVVVGYYILFSSLGSSAEPISSGGPSGSGLKILEIILWGLFIVLILLNGMTYIFNTSVTATLKNLFTSTPEVDIVLNTDQNDSNPLMPSSVPEITRKPQVFHIPGNKYTFDDSKAICSAYGGRLATYKEMEDSYKDGADWCSFGWSDGQMAFYPTQTEKWTNLQAIEGHEHDCGRPGINGGYIDNPNVRFGINCFGYKPKISQQEMEQMGNTPLYPKTNKEIDFDKKVDHWRSKLSEITVAPFNNANWSII